VSNARIEAMLKKNFLVFTDLNHIQSYALLQLMPEDKTWLVRQSKTQPGLMCLDYIKIIDEKLFLESCEYLFSAPCCGLNKNKEKSGRKNFTDHRVKH
jgi:hypothetical protein